MTDGALIQNDAVVVGVLAATLGAIFWTTESPYPFWRRFYRFVPALLLGFALGTYGGWLTGQLMRIVAGQ